MKRKFSLQLEHGIIEGIISESMNSKSPLVIITNGMNGFYNYGMFPYLQERLLENNISSISYNFSHGGVEGGNDYFTRIDLYEKNSMRLETADLVGLIQNLDKISLTNEKLKENIFLLSHSLGNYPTTFAAKDLLKLGYPIKGAILLAPSMTLDFWSKEQMADWEKDGFLMYPNKRTNQQLPLGKEFLEETKQSYDKWSLEKILIHVKIPFLILHGKNDDSIPIEEAVAINEWNKIYNNITELIIIDNCNHVFNTKHPFESTNPQLEFAISTVVNWINNLKH
jgi:pimeloyl-ACP methyl ester carboxylesterase